jgi:chromosome segregation ATPase
MIGCKSPGEKVDDAQEDVHEAEARLEEARRDSIAAEKEWSDFRLTAREQIEANKARIAELRDKKREKGKALDSAYQEEIDRLEERNDRLRARVDDYDKYHSDWETFKREFNRDMDELGEALKNMTVNNSK